MNYMRQLIKIFSTLIFMISTLIPAYCTVKGGIEYKIPIDYSKINKEEIESQANLYYNLALKTNSGKLNEEITTSLNLYTILNNTEPDNIIYPTRLGVLYDLIGKDKYAKGNFYKAIGIDNTKPEPYYYFGEFYYKRQSYKKALNMYNKAFVNGYNRHYETVYQIGDIYEKFGDTQASLKYLRMASELSPNENLDKKISKVENADKINREYYSNTRIHLIER